MMRLLLVGFFGYATYRMARAFVRSVPDDFEPVGLLPPARPQATRRPRARTANGRSARKQLPKSVSESLHT